MELKVDIKKSFPGVQLRFCFSLEKARCGILGPSGSGKSTLMNMIAGLITPDRGKIELDGVTLFNAQKKINLPPEKREVGVVFQHGHLFPHMDVERNLFYGRKRQKNKSHRINAEQLIEVLQLVPLLKRDVNRLSGGEKQRVALGRTILAEPRLILLDEPLSGLDEELKHQIIPYLHDVFTRFSIPMLFISHSLEEMRLLTDNLLVLGEGKIEKQLKTEELARKRSSTTGYNNLLQLGEAIDLGDLLLFPWGESTLQILKSESPAPGTFLLNARDILLFKSHPQATSARNMLKCNVVDTIRTEWLTRVVLESGEETLISEIVPQSVSELGIIPGAEIIAVFKASALQRLI